MQERLGDREIDSQGDRVHDGRDEGTGHDGGVEADVLCCERQYAADNLCDKDYTHKGYAHDRGHQNRPFG